MQNNHQILNHLKSFGEMGERISKFDWSQTSLGDSDQWPQSLITMITMMLENKFAMWIVWGPDNIQIYNESYARVLGSKHPEALGKPANETWKEVWDFVNPLLAQVKRGEAVQFDNQELEVELHGKFEKRFYTFGYTPLRSDDFSIGGALNTVIDTTSEFKAQKALVQSENKFRNLLEQSTLPFFSIKPDWIVDYMNPSGITMLGMVSEQIIGLNMWRIFPGLEESIFGEAYKKAMRERVQTSFIGYYPNFDRWYQVNAFPYDNGVGVSFLDITESKKLEAKLNEAVIVRDDFLSISSHELNTPLTSLKIQAQLLNRDIGKNSPKAFEHDRIIRFAELADKQITRMSRLIEDMLDVARIRSGKLNIKKEKFDLVMFMKDYIHRVESLFIAAQIKIPEVQLIKCEHIQGEWDLLRIEQVLNNLISNAIRYGEGKPIEISMECADKVAIIKVIDYGIGITSTSLEIIFNRFERASEKMQTKGLGLGLFISNQIVIAHGGHFKVESTVGKGSTFIVELPIH